MEPMLEEAGPVDLVIGDQGYAGAAIDAGIAVVTLLGTNDPVPAVARRLGADVTGIPDVRGPLRCRRGANPCKTVSEAPPAGRP